MVLLLIHILHMSKAQRIYNRDFHMVLMFLPLYSVISLSKIKFHLFDFSDYGFFIKSWRKIFFKKYYTCQIHQLFEMLEEMHFWIYSQRQKNSRLPNSPEQNHVLLFRKSEFLFFKVSNTNMRQIFFRNKTFLFLKLESWNF